jgi:hypothetical protein
VEAHAAWTYEAERRRPSPAKANLVLQGFTGLRKDPGHLNEPVACLTLRLPFLIMDVARGSLVCNWLMLT